MKPNIQSISDNATAPVENKQDKPKFFFQSTHTTTMPNRFMEVKKSTRTDEGEEEEHVQQLGDRKVCSKTVKDL